MTCPFCGGRLLVRSERDLGEGETGGRARAFVHRCTTCEVALAQLRVDKIGHGQESWRIDSPPRADRVVRPAGPSRAPPCERCGGDVIVAMPDGHVPAPAYAIGEMMARLEIRVETRCYACGITTSRLVPPLSELDRRATGIR